jgi:hypothetical protein
MEKAGPVQAKPHHQLRQAIKHLDLVMQVIA